MRFHTHQNGQSFKSLATLLMVRVWYGTLSPYCENINKHKLLEVNMMASRKVNNVHIQQLHFQFDTALLVMTKMWIQNPSEGKKMDKKICGIFYIVIKIIEHELQRTQYGISLKNIILREEM